MWLLRILTCFAYARRTSWPDRPTDSTWLAGNRSFVAIAMFWSMPQQLSQRACVHARASAAQSDSRCGYCVVYPAERPRSDRFLDLLGDPVLDSRVLAADLLQCQRGDLCRVFFSSIPRSSAVISRPPRALGIAPGESPIREDGSKLARPKGICQRSW